MPPKKKLRGEDGEAVEQDELAEDAAMMDGATAQLAATPKSGGLAHFTAGFAEGSAAEMEEDAKEDARKQLSVQACFQAPDTTLNVMVGTTGNILMTLNEGGLHYFYAGARANVGIRAGRYMFEVRVIELLNQTETGMQLRMPGPKHFLRIGFSTARCSPIMGDTEDSICFDSSGSLLFNRKQLPVSGKFLQDCTLAVVLNLDPDSPNNNTVSLFKDGRRQAPPQQLPENLQGKVLFPTLTYKNMSVHANFGPAAYVPLPFKCRTLQQAAVEDVEVVTYPASNGKYEVLFPVGLPGEGVFDWADWFLQRNTHYAEISERMVAEWATRSGIFRQKVPGIKGSNDRPEMNFGMPHLDDGTVKQILQSAAAAQQRDLLFLEVRNNLLRDERLQALRRFRLPHFKKVAKVLVGQPNDDYLQHLQKELLKEKQEKVFAEFEQKRQEHAQLKLLEMQKKQVEWARQKAELAQKQAEGPDADAAAEEVALGEEPMMEDTEEHPPAVELTEEEKKCCFKKPKPDATPDLMASALSSSFANFTIPGDDEGFDEVDFSWQPREAVEDYVRRWVQEHKITTRIDDLQPSEWFREKWQRWRDDLQRWHVLRIEFKDPAKRAALMAAKAKEKEEKEMAQKVEDKEQKEEEKQADQNGSKDVEMPEQKEEAKNGEQDKEQKEEAKPGEDQTANKDAEMPEQKEEAKNGEQAAKPEESEAAEAKMDTEVTGEPKESEESKGMETDAKEKKVEEEEEEENVDYLKELEAELEQAENDVFEIEDITDIGTGEPLFCNFGFEDWALLSLRFELHLLAHAFLHDCGDPERSGIYPDHILFYYNKYYKKGLQPKNYGVETVEELAGLVNDTVVICPPKVLESTLAPEQEGNDIFVKLTEEARRERLRRLDAGDESARLKFATGSNAVKASSKAPVLIPSKAMGPVITGPTGPMGKGEPMPQALLQQQRQQAARQQMQMPAAMPGAMPGAMPAAMQGGMPGAMQGGMPGAMQGGMPGGMPSGMPSGMPGGMPGAIPVGMQRPWMQQQGYGVPGVPLAQQRAMMARGGFGW